MQLDLTEQQQPIAALLLKGFLAYPGQQSNELWCQEAPCSWPAPRARQDMRTSNTQQEHALPSCRTGTAGMGRAQDLKEAKNHSQGCVQTSPVWMDSESDYKGGSSKYRGDKTTTSLLHNSTKCQTPAKNIKHTPTEIKFMHGISWG